MPLTFEDPSVVFDVKTGTILEASAGSGKTTILTERWICSFLYLLIWEKKTVSEALNSVVALTFTKKAASEMKVRIQKRIDELWYNNELEYTLADLKNHVGEYPNPKEEIVEYIYSLKQSIEDLLIGAKIMTINAYVLYLLRSNPLELPNDIGLNPEEGNYNISASEQETQLNVLRSLLQNKYVDHQKYFQLSVKLLGLNKFVSFLEQIRKLVSQYGHDAIEKALDNSLYFIYKDEILKAAETDRSLEMIYSLIEPSIRVLQEKLSMENNYKALPKLHAVLYQTLNNITPDSLLELFSKDFFGQYKVGKPVKDEELNLLREHSLFAYHNLIENLYRIIVPLIFEISKLCSTELKKLQAEYGEISFGESEIVLLETLKNDTFLKKIQEHLRFIFIDEFQDTSDLQKEIFDLIISNNDILPFFVGDPKQSIYSFRKANVYVFSETIKEFKERNYQHKILNTNYRSAKTHVELINFLFSNIFKNDHSGIVYHDQYAQKEDSGSFAYTLALGIDTESKFLTKEKLDQSFYDALFLVNKLLDQHVNPGDIMMLFRNRSSILEFYRLAKEYYPQLPLSSSVKDILWNNEYIMPLLGFLKILVNPYDELSMIELLKTPIFRKNDIEINELLLIAEDKKQSLFDVLEEQDRLMIKEFVVLRDRIPLEELITLLIEELDYEAYLALISETGEARATLSLFIEEAQKLQEKREMTLSDFISYIENKKTTVEEAEFAGEEGKTLRLMTIHAAKGLESPYVIYVHKPQLRDEILKFPLYKKNKIAFDILGKGQLSDELGQESLKESTAEEKRLAYVAITRAKKQFMFCALPSVVKSGNEIFETHWASFINKELIEGHPVFGSYRLDPVWDIKKQNNDQLLNDNTRYQERYEWLVEQEKKINFEKYPQFLSVSLLLDIEFNPEKFLDRYLKKSFSIDETVRELTEDEFTVRSGSQRDIGTLVHILLQYFDEQEDQELYEFLEKNYSDKKDIFKISVAYAVGYWNSDFYKNITKNSSMIDKERQIAYLLPNDIILRSTADLYMSSEDNKYTIVDYKLSVGKNLTRYHRQLSYYALMAENSGHLVDKLVLFSLKESKAYYLDWNKEQTENQFNSAVDNIIQVTKDHSNGVLQTTNHQNDASDIWQDTLF